MNARNGCWCSLIFRALTVRDFLIAVSLRPAEYPCLRCCLAVYTMYLHTRGPPMASATAQAQLVRWGNSLAVRIPKNVADEARLAEGDKLVLKVESPGNVAIKAVEKPSLEELL